MSYNTKEGFEAMQEDALRRVRDMQIRANRYVKNSEGYVKVDEPFPQPPPQQKPQPEANEQRPQQSRMNNSHADNGNMSNANYNAQHNIRGYQNNNFQGNMQPRPNILQSLFSGPQQRPGQPNNQGPAKSILSPLAQLFGSNLGGFNKMKNKQSDGKPGLFPSNDDDDTKTKSFIANLLKEFNIDEEKLMLILLIYILYKNGSDFKLIAALGYLLI